jgi:TPP-dependent pyruvate/acetoin dehydrogenase alpha subunit
MMAELLGRSTGYCRGKGGSMHIADFDIGILGANGIVAGGTSIAVGAGITSRIVKKNDCVTICFFGEGATNEGIFHESVNLAALWKLPIVFLCENNLYQVFTTVAESLPVPNVSVRAGSYGIPGVQVDGNDVPALLETVAAAVARARSGEGPTLVEAMTYRWDGHYTGDSYSRGGYRSVEEVEAWKMKDPIPRLAALLLKEGLATQAQLDGIQTRLAEEIAQAAEFAKNSPWPEDDELMQDIFAAPKQEVPR